MSARSIHGALLKSLQRLRTSDKTAVVMVNWFQFFTPKRVEPLIEQGLLVELPTEAKC